MSSPQRPLLHLDGSTKQRPELQVQVWTCLHNRGLSCTWTCLHHRGLCCTLTCLRHRGLSCTWTCLDKRNLCWPLNVSIHHRGLSCTWTFLDYRSLCCSWTCLHYRACAASWMCQRGLNCTCTCLDNTSFSVCPFRDIQNFVHEKSRNSAKFCINMRYGIPRNFRQFRTENGRDGESTKNTEFRGHPSHNVM